MISLNDDLISWWSMNDDPACGMESDELKRTQLVATNLTQISGLIGKAVRFNAAGTSRLQAASNSLLQLAQRPFTLALWVKFNALSGNPVLISKADSNPISSGFRLEYDSFAQAITFRVGNASFANQVLAFNSASPPLNVWHFILAWLDASDGKLHIRMDDSNYEGVSVNDMVDGMDVNDLAFSIGSNPDGTNPLNGAIDSVALWGRELTRTEQMLLWNRGMGADYCALIDNDCKTIDCCDLTMFAYNASTSSNADGRQLKLRQGIAPIMAGTPPVVPPVDYDPCAAPAPYPFLTLAATGQSLGWQSRWNGIAYCDSLDRVVADSDNDTGIAILNFNVSPPVLDHILPLNTPFETRGLFYHFKADVIIVWVRYGIAPNYNYRLAFLDPVSGFSSEVNLGVAGGNAQYEATFTTIGFRTIGVLIRSLTLNVPHLIAVVDVQSRAVIVSKFFDNDGSPRPTRDFFGLQYSCVLGELVSIENKIDVDGVFFKNYLVRFNVATLAITQEFLLPAGLDIRNPQYITSTGKLIGWDVTGYYDIDPATGTAVLIDNSFTGNVVPLYSWRLDKLITIDESNALLMLLNPHDFTKTTTTFPLVLGDAYNFAAGRFTSKFYTKNGLFAPFPIQEFDVS